MRAADIQQVIINLLKAVEGPESLQLTPGQIVSVLLKEVQGNMALLSLQGRDTTARLETDLPAGARLKCLVEGEKDGQVILKVLGGSGEEANGVAIRSILKGLGLPDDQLNRRLVQEMMKQELPLTPDLTRLLSAFARSGQVQEGDLRFAVFMLKQGLPLNDEMFQAVKQLFTDMNFLQAGLEKLVSGTQVLTAGSKPEADLNQLALQISKAINDMQILSSEGQDSLSARLGAIIREMLPRSQGGPGTDAGFQDQIRSGTAQQGTAQQGTAQQGMAQQGTAQQGTAQQGTAQQGTAQPGMAAVSTQQPGIQQTGTGQADLGQVAGQTAAGQAGAGQADTGRAGTIAASGDADAAVLAKAGAGEMTGQERAETIGSNAGHGAESAQRQALPETAAGNAAGTAMAGKTGNLESGKTADIIKLIAGRLSELAGQKAVPLDMAARDGLTARIAGILEQSGSEKPQQADLRSLVEQLINSLSADSRPEHGEIIQAARTVMERLDFIQSFNRAEPGRENYIFIYSSVRFDDKQEPLRMIVNYRYDGKNNKKDFTSCRVEVKLHTPGLGLVRCDIQVNSRNLTVQFISDNDRAAGIIDRARDSLGHRLEQLKYQVKMLPCRVQSGEETGFFPDEKPDIPGLFRVNLRV